MRASEWIRNGFAEHSDDLLREMVPDSCPAADECRLFTRIDFNTTPVEATPVGPSTTSGK